MKDLPEEMFNSLLLVGLLALHRLQWMKPDFYTSAPSLLRQRKLVLTDLSGRNGSGFIQYPSDRAVVACPPDSVEKMKCGPD